MSKPRLRVIPSDCARVDVDCVRTMAQMYRRALRGEFQSVALATVTEGPEGSFGTAWSVPERASELAGSINYLNHRFLQEIYDR
jgi:hypothetical protein